MRFYLVICLIYGLLFALVYFQNNTTVNLRLFTWQLDHISLISIIASSFCGGALFIFLFGFGYQLQVRRRLKSYEKNNKVLLSKLKQQPHVDNFEDTRPLPPV